MQAFQLETHLCALFLSGAFQSATAERTKRVSAHTKTEIVETPLSYNKFVVAKDAGVIFIHRGSIISLTGGDEVRVYSSLNSLPMAVEIIRHSLPNTSADKHIHTAFRHISEIRGQKFSTKEHKYG